MRCKACHYSLANLTKNRCPECGRAFDPNDPSTFISERYQRPTLRQYLAVSGIVWLGVFVWLALMMFPLDAQDYEHLLFVGSVATGIVLLAWMVDLIPLLLHAAWKLRQLRR